jgi:hypothetical protein
MVRFTKNVVAEGVQQRLLAEDVNVMLSLLGF